MSVRGSPPVDLCFGACCIAASCLGKEAECHQAVIGSHMLSHIVVCCHTWSHVDHVSSSCICHMPCQQIGDSVLAMQEDSQARLWIYRRGDIAGLRYDSVYGLHPYVDAKTSSRTPIYITYNTGHAYPKFLITYKR